MSKKDEAILSLLDIKKKEHAKIKIVPIRQNSLWVLPNHEAVQFSEESVQLFEGYTYEYELFDVEQDLRLRANEIVRRSNLSNPLDRGTIEPGLHTGRVQLTLENLHGEEIATTSIEVRSIKLTYREDYREMLNDIAEISSDLLLEMRSASQLNITSDPGSDSQTVYQRYAFVSSLIFSKNFQEAIQQIVKVPHVKLSSIEEQRNVSMGFKPTKKTINQIAKGTSRQSLTSSHQLHNLMTTLGISNPSIPRQITISKNIETIDLPENRFIKHILEEFKTFFELVNKKLIKLNGKDNSKTSKEVHKAIQFIDNHLELSFFKQLGPISFVPITSPVLQRKNGYREVFQAWLKFTLASKLIWNGGSDVYGANKRDIAILYEYWIFFKLLKVIQQLVDIKLEKTQLFDITKDGFGLMLKKGKSLDIEGVFEHTGYKVKIQLNYNKTFTTKLSPAYSGSWTRQMRPDYTISIFPENLSVTQAEEVQLIEHLHFDAKYRLNNIESFTFSNDKDEQDEASPNYKRDDLLKMHSYKDAIRNTSGAYILYPGNSNQVWYESDNLLPSVGAFSLRPSSEKINEHDLFIFIRDNIQYISDRFKASTP